MSLKTIRRHSRSWLAKVLIAVIVLSFAAFGLEQFFYGHHHGGGHYGDTVLSINDRDIDAGNFFQLVNYYRNQIAEERNVDVESIDLASAAQITIEREVARTVTEQKIREYNLYASTEEFEQALLQDERFQSNGVFDRTLVENYTRGSSWQQFTDEYKQILANEHLSSGILYSHPTITKQSHSLARAFFNTRSFDLLTIDVATIATTIEPTTEQVQDHYQDTSNDYRTPERVQIRYIALRASDFSDDATLAIDEATIEAELATRANHTPDEYAIAHIFFAFDTDNALEAAENTYQQLQENPERFAELAEQLSDDTASAAVGGSLGNATVAEMEPAIADQVLLMQAGEISPPVTTDFGYHIVRLDGNIAAEAQDDEETLRAEIVSELRQQRLDEIMVEKSEALANTIFSSASLEQTAELLGYDIEQSPFFSRIGGEVGITASRQVIDTAFADAYKNTQVVTELIDADDTTKVVFQVNAVAPSEIRPLAEVTDAVRQAFIGTRSQTLATEYAQTIADHLANNTDLNHAIEDIPLDLAWETFTDLSAVASQTIDAATLENIFTIDAQQINTVHRFTTHSGQVLVYLRDVAYPPWQALGAMERFTTENYLVNNIGQQFVDAIETTLRQEATIVDNTDEVLQTLF